MGIESILKKELKLEDNFDYHVLYNDDRGSIHKDEYKSLIYWCIKEKVIEVKKYLIQEKVSQDIFYDIVDKKGREQYQLKEVLKEYHQENYYNIAPFIYLLEIVEPNYKINSKRKEYEDPVLEFPDNISVGHRFKGTNAFSRLYFKDDKIAINSFNDEIENLVDTLEIDDINVYVLVVENIVRSEQNIVLYKLTKNDMFNKLKDEAEHKFLEEIHKYINKL